MLNDTQVFLLAAGRGSRAGGPKAWQSSGGEPALTRHVRAALRVEGAVSVSIQAAWLDSCRELFPAVKWVVSDPDRPPLASLQAMLAARPSNSPGFVYHVDMPVFEQQMLEAVHRGLENYEACVPLHLGRRGHPVLLSAALYPRIARLDPDKDRLDEFLRECRVSEVNAGSPAVLENRNS